MKKFAKCMVIIALCLAMTAVGVWAAVTKQIDVGGKIYFEYDDGVYFDAFGKVSVGTWFRNFDYSVNENDAGAASEPWSVPDIYLTAAEKVITYEFTVTNTSTNNSITVVFSSSPVNVNYTLTKTEGELTQTVAPGATAKVVYTIELNNVNAASSSDASFTIKISKAA